MCSTLHVYPGDVGYVDSSGRQGGLAIGLDMNKFFIAAIICATAAGAQAQSLWLANGWNAFVRGNFTSSGSDTEGRVAVGGNLNVSSYAVGLQLPSNFTGDSLYVQGDFKFLGGSVYHGDVRTLDTTPTTANLTISNGSSIKITPAPFWIPTIFTELIGRAGYWGHLSPTATTSFQYNGLTLSGGSGTTRIFNVNGDDLSVANNFTIDLPAGVTALVNITGRNPKFKNAGFNLQGGITKEKVLLNFWEANTVELSGVGIYGNLLGRSTVKLSRTATLVRARSTLGTLTVQRRCPSQLR